LALSDTLVRPLAKSQYVARQAAGMVIVTIVLFIWFYGSLLRDKLAVFATLRTPEAARRFLTFAVVVVVAILPSDIYLTRTWSSYLDVVRAEVLAKGGVIAFEDSPLSRHPYDLLVEAWILPSQSLALRAKRGDGIIAPPRDFKSWQPFPPTDPYPLGKYTWRD
jgi:hypothetical protein